MEFSRHVLENGMEIVAECNAEAHSAAVAFFVKTGARDETEPVAGVSHFLEHMVFKGTPNRSADDVNQQLDQIGAHYNAFTNEENTVYYAAVLPEYVDSALEILSDILRPSLREADFQTEKQVILEEIRMYDDQPPFGADEKCRAAFYGSHPLGNSVLGTTESVGHLQPEAMRKYFRRRYSPGNITLVAAGRIDFDALVAAATRYCGHWDPLSADRTLLEAAPNRGFVVLHKPTATQQYAIQLSPGPTASETDHDAAKLLANVLGDDTGSRLYWEIVDPGLAEHVSLSHGEHEDAGIMATYLCCDPDATADNLKRILDVYRRAEADGITPAELDAAKSKIRSRIVLSSERPRNRLFTVGMDWLQRREYFTVANDLAIVAAITVDDLNAVLSRCPLTQSMTVTIGPLRNVTAPQ